jgi:hypothetical protein
MKRPLRTTKFRRNNCFHRPGPETYRACERGAVAAPKTFLFEESNVNILAKLCTAALVTVALSGCVYVNGKQVDMDDWRETQSNNREAISKLNVGMSRSAVIDRLGTPDDSEAFTENGEEYRVLFYRTRHKHSDGETTRDETTPLVFRNDELVGWGNAVYEGLR